MTTFALIHGGGSSASGFDLLAAELEARGHEVVAIDLPIEDPAATLSTHADAVAAALGEREGIVVVGHSYGGLTAPLVCTRAKVELLVLMGAMVPKPGETAGEWWEASGWSAATESLDMSDDVETFLHDVPAEVAAAELASSRDQADASASEPWPLDAWPDVPTRFLLFADDRFFPAEFQRAVARERLGIAADEMPGSHCAYLSRPAELADRLVEFWHERAAAPTPA